jgi:DMSO/TMAO reductase YedYZ molybdopterin-dependent catalytic subunit
MEHRYSLMVFSPLHWIPSALAAILILTLALTKGKGHKNLTRGMLVLAVIGLIGYLSSGFSSGYLHLLSFDFHMFHAWIGIAALLTSIYVFAVTSRSRRQHCYTGYLAAALAVLALTTGALLLSGQTINIGEPAAPTQSIQEPSTSQLPEVEASRYQGFDLAPLKEQRNNAIIGTQHLNRTSYSLRVTGLVKNELNLSYDQLLAMPAYSEMVYMPCVEGWGFNAKWTGFRASDLLDKADMEPEARYLVFRSADGYSTALPLDYIKSEKILLAYGINDLTLPDDRGFPLQLVAKSKYGYKWAKWVTEVEATSEDVRGYWESRGYSESANVGENPFV